MACPGRRSINGRKNITAPDTQNLIILAQILGTTADYIISGNNSENTGTSHRKIWGYLAVAIITAVITVIATVLYIANAPVSFDAGACGGGFATAVYDQYADSLIKDNLFYITRDYQDSDVKITAVTPVRESRDVHYEGKAIYMSFDVDCTFSDSSCITEKLRFVGERKWIQVYDWRMIN